MTQDQRYIQFEEDPRQGPPAEAERVLSEPAIGAIAGLVIGILVDLVFDRFGGGSNALSVLAVHAAAVVIGLVMGMLLSVAGRSRLDAPVRERRLLRQNRAGTTERPEPIERR